MFFRSAATTSQRPPVSTASTASTASAPDVRSRYADHAVLMTSLPEPPKAKLATKSAKGKASMMSSKSAAGVQSSDSEISVESVHSIWEVKPPQATNDCPYASIDQKRAATSLFLQPYVLKQLLQEQKERLHNIHTKQSCTCSSVSVTGSESASCTEETCPAVIQTSTMKQPTPMSCVRSSKRGPFSRC